MDKAVIAIKRPSEFAYVARAFNIFIDDAKVGTIKSGQEERFEAAPGTHSVYATVDFHRSKPLRVEVRTGETIILACGAKQGIGGVLSAFTKTDDYLYMRLEEGSDQAQAVGQSSFRAPEEQRIKVELESQEERVQAASEEVHVPAGVTVKVKRSRTIEHTVEIDWNVVGEGRLDIGIKQILGGSIRGEISRKHGQSSKESETMEYEIDLSGNTCSRYRLVWMDVWLKGQAEVDQKGTATQVPFRFRDRSELEVVPVT